MLMWACRRVGFERLAWSLRRLHCPVSSDALVLEVGSGGNPYYRANVLLDAYEETRERHWVKLISDRPTMIGFVENLPFKDKVFDFVVASHVLEHSTNPMRFLSELQRVARAGYIEVPDALMERLNPYLDHRLEITIRDGRLVIRKKPTWNNDADVVELYNDRAGAIIAGETIPRHPFHFHVRHYWTESINFIVVNPEIDAAWLAPASNQPITTPSLRARANGLVLSLLRRLLSQRRRNSKMNWISLLRCPECHWESLELTAGYLVCPRCVRQYPIKHGVPHLTVAADFSAEPELATQASGKR